MTPLMLTLDQLPDSTVVHAAGDIDATNRAFLADALTEGRRRGKPLIVDFSAVTFLDSSGLHVLIDAQTRATLGKSGFHLAALHPRVLRLLQIAGVAQVLNVHDSVEQARTAVERWSATK